MIPVAINDDNCYITVKDVLSDDYKKCRLRCPVCMSEVISKVNGKKRIPHFAHKSTTECSGGGEGSKHRLAKNMIASDIEKYTFTNECKKCHIVSERFTFNNSSTCVEMSTGSFIVDVGISGDTPGVVEIHNTNPVHKSKNKYLVSTYNDHAYEVCVHDVLDGKLDLKSNLICSKCFGCENLSDIKSPIDGPMENDLEEKTRDLFLKQDFSQGSCSKLFGTAGSGKTTLIESLIKNNKSTRFIYLCFNKDLQVEIKNRFDKSCPSNVDVFTFDSIWYKLSRIFFKDSSFSPAWSIKYNTEMESFLNGDNIDDLETDIKEWISKMMENEKWFTYKRKAHYVYTSGIEKVLKFFISYDVVICDEAQDMQPMTSNIIRDYVSTVTHVIYAGDPDQQLYTFSGAVNAMEGINGVEFVLNKTFRFGGDLCDFVNKANTNRYRTFPGREITTPVIRNELFETFNNTSYTYLFRGVSSMVQSAECIANSGLKVRLDYEKRIKDLKRERREMYALEVAGKPIYIQNSTQTWLHKLTSVQINEMGKLFKSMVPREGEKYVEFSTVHKYKGKEADIVRVCNDVIVERDINIKNVAFTRARKLLVLD